MKTLISLLLCLLIATSGCSSYRNKNVATIEHVSDVKQVDKNQYFITAKFTGGSSNNEQRITLVKKKLSEFYTIDPTKRMVVEEYAGDRFNEFNYIISME